MRAKHFIFWHKYGCRVIFTGKTSKMMRGSVDEHEWGFGTACGEIFWPDWKGTTDKNEVTCKNCLNSMVLRNNPLTSPAE